MRAARTRALSTGTVPSSVPCATSVGCAISPRRAGSVVILHGVDLAGAALGSGAEVLVRARSFYKHGIPLGYERVAVVDEVGGAHGRDRVRDLARRHEPHHVLRRRQHVRRTSCGRARQDELSYARRVFDGKMLGHHAAERRAEHVRRGDAEFVEQCHCVASEVLHGHVRRTSVGARRAARIEDDHPEPLGQRRRVAPVDLDGAAEARVEQQRLAFTVDLVVQPGAWGGRVWHAIRVAACLPSSQSSGI